MVGRGASASVGSSLGMPSTAFGAPLRRAAAAAPLPPAVHCACTDAASAGAVAAVTSTGAGASVCGVGEGEGAALAEDSCARLALFFANISSRAMRCCSSSDACAAARAAAPADEEGAGRCGEARGSDGGTGTVAFSPSSAVAVALCIVAIAVSVSPSFTVPPSSSFFFCCWGRWRLASIFFRNASDCADCSSSRRCATAASAAAASQWRRDTAEAFWECPSAALRPLSSVESLWAALRSAKVFGGLSHRAAQTHMSM